MSAAGRLVRPDGERRRPGDATVRPQPLLAPAAGAQRALERGHGPRPSQAPGQGRARQFDTQQSHDSQYPGNLRIEK